MCVTLNRLPHQKPPSVLIKKAAGYISLLIGAALFVAGLQLLHIFEPAADEL
jgi:hypothetical protein